MLALGERRAGAQRHRLAVLDPVEGEREYRAGKAVQRGDRRGEPAGRGAVEVEQRHEGDVQQIGAARGIVARERGDPRPHLGRRLRHDIERVAGAHG